MTTIYHEQGFDEDRYFGVQVDCPECKGEGCWKCNEEGWIVSTQITNDKDNADIPY